MTESLRLAICTASPEAAGLLPLCEAPTSDVVLSCNPATMKVADVAEMIGFPRGPLLIDSRLFAGSAQLAETTIADGSIIANPADQTRCDIDPAEKVLVVTTVIAGPHTGRQQRLPIGRYERRGEHLTWSLASGAGRTASLTLEVQIGAVLITPGQSAVVVNDAVLTGPTTFPLGSVPAVINLGSERIIVGPAGAQPQKQSGADPAVHRIPRVNVPEPVPTYFPPELPKDPGEKPSFSWIAMLLPLPIAGVMALALGLRYLLFGLMSPAMMVGRWFENRRTYRKQVDTYSVALAEARRSVYGQIKKARDEASAFLTEVAPGPATLTARALSNDPRLWERRPGHADFGKVTIGYADLPWRYEPRNAAGQREAVLAATTDLVDGFAYVPSAPVVVDIAAGSLGIVGPRDSALAAARGVVVSLTTLSGPADLPIALIGAEDGMDSWDWAKWLPHLGTPNRLGGTPTEVDAIVAKYSVAGVRQPKDGLETHPLCVLVIDGNELVRRSESNLRRALSERSGISGLVLAETANELPASCNWILTIDVDGLASLADMATGRRVANVTPVGVNEATAAGACRSMARLTDPDANAAATDLPSLARLPSLVGSVKAEAVLERWEQGGANPDPVATIGVGPSGTLRIDMVRDGPHGLLAGTTGAGKSELLRSFVLSMATLSSPDHVNFVLVDFKGGGAFDACAELPHTVAVVTDLDGHLGARTLRSLQAELRFREVAFREVGAHDLGSYRAGGGVMPRLLVAVDEFATLAAELPDFLDALVDIAQRGRSLGIHMVLATQRPAGVLDAKIKSNTNLRISLRVQDDNDSMDVIGTNQAARLGRGEIGRGFVRMGAGDIIPFQAAYAGGVSPEASMETAVGLSEYRLGKTGVSNPPSMGGELTDMEQMVAEIVLANDKAEIAPPRRPWLPELPPALALDDLPSMSREGAGRSPGAIVIGLLDVPAEQRRESLLVDVAAGNIAIYGAEQTETSATLQVLVAQLLHSVPSADLHLYLLDSSFAGLRDFRLARSVGAYVPHDDDDLLNRVFDLFDGILDERKALRAEGGDLGDLPLTVIIVDGLGSLVERLAENADHALLTRLGALLRQGSSLGVTMVCSASSARQIPGRLATQFGVKLIHQLTDPAAVVSFGLRQKDVPIVTGRMIIDVGSGLDGVAASVSSDEIAGVVAAAQHGSERPPARLRVLGRTTSMADLTQAPVVTVNRLCLPVGARIRDVSTALLAIDDRAVILGGASSGRTTALVHLTQQALAADLEGEVVVLVTEDSPLAALAGVVLISPEAALDESQMDRIAKAALLVIDDADRVHPDLGKQLRPVVEKAGRGHWILAAMRPADVKAMVEWTSLFRGCAAGVLLKPQAADGDTLRVMLPAKSVATLRAHQGIMVLNGEMTAIQLALPAQF